MSRDIPAGPDAATLARAVSEVLEPTFSRLARVAAAVAASRPGDGAMWSERHLGVVMDQVDVAIAEDALAVGMGFVAAPGAVEGRDRFMAWRQRLGEKVMRLQLNFDPTSVDVYDYLQMEWFQLAEQGRERVAFVRTSTTPERVSTSSPSRFPSWSTASSSASSGPTWSPTSWRSGSSVRCRRARSTRS